MTLDPSLRITLSRKYKFRLPTMRRECDCGHNQGTHYLAAQCRGYVRTPGILPYPCDCLGYQQQAVDDQKP